jgi:hypothetical protein
LRPLHPSEKGNEHEYPQHSDLAAKGKIRVHRHRQRIPLGI